MPVDQRMREAFCGCLMGSAVADTLLPAGSGASLQTRMALLTADGMLRGWVRFRLKGLGPVFASTVTNAYGRLAAPGGPGWLMGQRELWTPSTASDPGGTAADAIARVAPAGMFLSAWVESDATTALTIFQLGATLGAPERSSAGVFALATAWLMRGIPLPEALERAKATLRAQSENDALAPVFEFAVRCALEEPDFQSGILRAACREEDRPAVMSMVGALLGARFGRGRIPARWLAPVGWRGAIEEMADDLASAPEWQIGGFRGAREDRAPIDRYPPN